jgi:hypothetical protein
MSALQSLEVDCIQIHRALEHEFGAIPRYSCFIPVHAGTQARGHTPPGIPRLAASVNLHDPFGLSRTLATFIIASIELVTNADGKSKGRCPGTNSWDS